MTNVHGIIADAVSDAHTSGQFDPDIIASYVLDALYDHRWMLMRDTV